MLASLLFLSLILPVYSLSEHVDPLTGVTFLRVPSGKFLFGKSKKQKVHISKDFYLGKFEVTQKQWRQVMGSDSWKIAQRRSKQLCPTREGDNFPVGWLSHDDVMKFIERVNSISKHSYRLPTEAEFEYAARAGGNFDYTFGDNPEKLCEYGNVADQSMQDLFPHWKVAPCDDGFNHPAPVGSFKPNPWGFHDMVGNLWNWTSDWHSSSKEPSNQMIIDPKGPPSGEFRVKKGGCFFGNHKHVKVGESMFNKPDFHWCFMGFRLVKEVSD